MASIKDTTFQALPYAYDALEPHIDALTVEIHYSRHHKAYFDNLQNAVAGTELAELDFVALFKNISKVPPVVRNNGGGYINHVLYWENMSPNGGGLPTGALALAIDKTFGSFDEFKKQFSDAGKTRFGSGWAWLSVDANGELFVSSTPNQDNPYMDVADKQGTPI